MFAQSYLDRHGRRITHESGQGKVSLKHSTRGTNFGLRGAAFEGWINIKVPVGFVFHMDDETFLVISCEPDMGAYAITVLKVNSTLDSLVESWGDDGQGGFTVIWEPKDMDIPAYGQVVTAALRQTDPGILSTTTRMYHLNAEVSVLGRIIHHYTEEETVNMGGIYDERGGMRLRIDSVDDIMLPGIKRIQCSMDER